MVNPPHDDLLIQLHKAGFAERRPEGGLALGYDDFRLTRQAINAYYNAWGSENPKKTLLGKLKSSLSKK